MATPRLAQPARYVWTMLAVIQSHNAAAFAFAPPNSLPSRALPPRPPVCRPNCPQRHHTYNSQSTPQSTTAIHLGLEDIVFSAQNAGSSLANTVISSGSSGADAGSLLVLYAAGLVTSFSPCSLGLLPITVSYITTAAQERKDKETILPTLAFAAGLALVFTALGVSASAIGGVFGSTGGGSANGEDAFTSLILAAISSLISVLMGLQLLELIRIPLPSLDFKWRSALAFDSGRGSGANTGGGSLFDENGGLILDNLQSSQEGNAGEGEDGTAEEETNELAALIRTFLLGGTSALVASPCATPVLASLLAYLATVSTDASSSGDIWKGASWMLSYTLGYSTPLLAVGATGGQALVNLQKAKADSGEGFNLGATLGQWITPLTGGVLITFGMNGFLIAMLGDPSLSALAPIID
mmetsp:Transcript_35904/g.75590  ORF Transcript_35904/g.75590 Transcript_35904/m.75590 type:complete len:412 (+) Transcript_35904:161-1396(+)